MSDFGTLESNVNLLNSDMETFSGHVKRHIQGCFVWKIGVSTVFKRGFLDVDVAVLGGSVSLLTGGIVFPSVAVGSHDRIGMWSLKISLLAHERPKELV